MFEKSQAEQDVLTERRRHVEVEGWTAEHDDQHDDGSMADVAACYAATVRVFKCETIAGRGYEPAPRFADLWPWDDKWWKPKDRRRDLVRAAALIIAEIERLDRAGRRL